MPDSEDWMSWLWSTWSVGRMGRAVVKHYLSGLYEPDLSKSIVDYLELLCGQVSVYFNHDSPNSNTSCGASDHVDHRRYSIMVVIGEIDKLVLLPTLVSQLILSPLVGITSNVLGSAG